MLQLPSTIEDLERLISEETHEDLHLEYKRSTAIEDFDEMAKDVSAFANSDGGILIYGIEEGKDHKPLRIDAGVDYKKFNRKRIENILTSRIAPRIDEIVIKSIQVSEFNSAYVIRVSKSYRGPHQAPDKKYYKRFNFKSQPMEDYELSDVRNRRRVAPALISINFKIKHGFIAYLAVSNFSQNPAEQVKFQWSEKFSPWISQNDNTLFTRGTAYFPPNKTYTFFYGPINAILNGNYKGLESKFEITASYCYSEAESKISEEFQLDLADYWGQVSLKSDVEEQGGKIKEVLEKLTRQLERLNGNVEQIKRISSPTGLKLSFSTLKNLRRISAEDKDLEKIAPIYLSYDAFMEILGVDYEMADRLTDYFNGRSNVAKLAEVEGITEEILEKLRTYFILEEN